MLVSFKVFQISVIHVTVTIFTEVRSYVFEVFLNFRQTILLVISAILRCAVFRSVFSFNVCVLSFFLLHFRIVGAALELCTPSEIPLHRRGVCEQDPVCCHEECVPVGILEGSDGGHVKGKA